MTTNAVTAPDQPWMIREVIDWLASIVRSDSVVLETGAGGSTVWLASRCGRLITYEHDPEWLARVRSELAQRVPHKRVEFRYRMHYAEAGLGPTIPPLDLALIDGRGRVRSVLDARRACAVMQVAAATSYARDMIRGLTPHGAARACAAIEAIALEEFTTRAREKMSASASA